MIELPWIVQLGDPIPMSVRVENLGAAPITYGDSGVAPDIGIALTESASGRACQFTTFGNGTVNDEQYKRHYGYAILKLQPGETRVWSNTSLGECFVLNQGKYDFSVTVHLNACSENPLDINVSGNGLEIKRSR